MGGVARRAGVPYASKVLVLNICALDAFFILPVCSP